MAIDHGFFWSKVSATLKWEIVQAFVKSKKFQNGNLEMRVQIHKGSLITDYKVASVCEERKCSHIAD